ncbi:hypothetical protein T439DRAFT_380804 [Meredithblackwellia eburnea MCA 4105]
MRTSLFKTLFVVLSLFLTTRLASAAAFQEPNSAPRSLDHLNHLAVLERATLHQEEKRVFGILENSPPSSPGTPSTRGSSQSQGKPSSSSSHSDEGDDQVFDQDSNRGGRAKPVSAVSRTPGWRRRQIRDLVRVRRAGGGGKRRIAKE